MSDQLPFLPGDVVIYVGDRERLREKLNSKEGNAKGVVHARVANDPSKIVVSFPSLKEDPSWIMHQSELKKAKVDTLMTSSRRKRNEDE